MPVSELCNEEHLNKLNAGDHHRESSRSPLSLSLSLSLFHIADISTSQSTFLITTATRQQFPTFTIKSSAPQQ